VLLQQDSIAKRQVDQQAALVKQPEGTVKIDQSMVDNAKLQLSHTNITAPIGGRLGLKVVDPGTRCTSPTRMAWRPSPRSIR
jgi:multidrug efflux system membrane fusion protein